jgi:hypothetical protein
MAKILCDLVICSNLLCYLKRMSALGGFDTRLIGLCELPLS